MISVISTTYNRAGLLERAIKSVRGQTYENWEFIIVDDGSTDHTEAMVQKYLSDSRIRYIKKDNSGAAHSRNVGASVAKGDFITFLDSDDEALPNWLETATGYIKENTGIICAGAIRKFADGTTKEEYPYEINFYGGKAKVKFTAGSLFIRRSIFLEINGYDLEVPTGFHSELGYRLIEHLGKNGNRFTISSIPECLVNIYVHEGPRARTDLNSLFEDCVRFVHKFQSYFKKWDRRELSNNYAVIAYLSYKLKNKRLSLCYLARAIRYNPLKLKNYFRVIKYGFL